MGDAAGQEKSNVTAAVALAKRNAQERMMMSPPELGQPALVAKVEGRFHAQPAVGVAKPIERRPANPAPKRTESRRSTWSVRRPGADVWPSTRRPENLNVADAEAKGKLDFVTERRRLKQCRCYPHSGRFSM